MNASAQQNNPYAPPTAAVSDATSDAGVEPADRGTRLGAAIVDILINFVVALPMGISVGLSLTSPSEIAQAMFGIGGLVTFALAIAWIVYTIYLVNKNGQTIGKKLLGIKVVRSNGTKASLGRIFWLRNVVNAIPGMIPMIGYFYVLADHLWIFSERRQCLHDKIADTIVVKA